MPDSAEKNPFLNSTMSLGDHLEELRMRILLGLAGLVVGAIIAFCFGTRIITFIQGPYNRLMPDHPLVALGPSDAFIGYMKISLLAGLIFSSPWVFYQIWAFIATGLYTRERRYVHVAVPFCVFLFVSGALFFIYVVAPISLSFFLKFGDIINVAPSWTFQKYVSFVTVLMLVFGLAFQTPAVIYFLNRTGLVSIDQFRRSRKYVLLGIFIIAAVATPPDVISQITLALPLYLLFELGILLSYLSSRKNK